jgi:hypothetical protein
MSLIHFTSTDWWIDVLDDSEDREPIRLHGKADFLGRKNVKMHIQLSHQQEPILKYLSMKPQNNQIDKLRDLLQQKKSEGICGFHNKDSDSSEDFIWAYVLISKSAWQSIYDKISNPPPLCIISLSVVSLSGPAWEDSFSLVEINPVVSSSISLKYQN